LPSPFVHSLAALALDRLSRSRRPAATNPAPDRGDARRRAWRMSAALVFAGNAADLDFIPGILIGEPGLFHHGPTHSLLAAAIVGVLAAPFARWIGFGSARSGGLALALAFASHLLLDMMAVDDGRPSAVPLFWPISSEMIYLPLGLFVAIRIDPAAPGFITSLLTAYNAKALVWEVTIVIVALALIRAAYPALLRPDRPRSTASRDRNGRRGTARTPMPSGSTPSPDRE
jgi:membrane-bound metal-dependent hydrolase YbcI (DUF457 family)